MDDGQRLALLNEIVSHARADVYAERFLDTKADRWAYRPVKQPLTEAIIKQHMNGGPHIGVYLIKGGAKTTRLAVLDLDDHGGTADPAQMKAAAKRLLRGCAALGLKAWPTLSGGGKGIHLYYKWSDSLSAADVRRTLQLALNAEGFTEGASGVAKGEIEIFPKQDAVAVDGFGSLVGLPFARESKPLSDDMKVIDEVRAWPDSAPVKAVAAGTSRAGNLKEALGFVKADEYAQWIWVGLALKKDLGENGFGLWDEWSASSEKYCGHDNALIKWNEFKPRGEIGLASVFHVARENGYSGGGSDEEVEKLNAEYAVVLVGGKAAILKESKERGRHKIDLLGKDAFTTWLGNRHIEFEVINKKGQSVIEKKPLAQHWLASHERRQYSGLVFAPMQVVDGFYNMWRGFSVQSREGECGLFLDHMKDNVCRGSQLHFNWVMGWFADIVQHPEKKSGTSLVLRGKMGTGKTKVGQVVGALMRDHYALVSDPRYVTGQFNSHMVSCLLLHADEAFWAGDKTGEGKIKDLVTGEDHFIEYKGFEPMRFDNYLRLLVTGNPEWVIPAGLEERRFAVFDIGDGKRGDIDYFAAIDVQQKSGGKEALLYWLLNFDLSSVDLRTIPKTAALLAQKIASLTPEQGWWLDALMTGRLPAGCDVRGHCPAQALFDHYILHAQKSGARRRSIQIQLGHTLRKMVPTMVARRNNKYTGPSGYPETGTVYEFPKLAECRGFFNELTGQQIEWDDGDWAEVALPGAF